MTAYYRNRETGIIQQHPKSGLGETFNSDEVGQDGKPVKSPVSPVSDDKGKQPKSKADGPDAPEAKTGTGSPTKQEGDQ